MRLPRVNPGVTFLRILLVGLLGLGLSTALVIGLVGTSESDTTPPVRVPEDRPADAPPDPAPGRIDGQPNVVLVMADDMRADDLLFAPALRRLVARHGLQFSNSFSPYPLCCPARASFLTGRYAHNHRVFWHEPPYGYAAFDDSRTLATAMRRAGYRTGFIGKYLNRYGLDTSKVSGEPSHTYVPNGWDDWRAAVEAPPGAGFSGDTYQFYDTPYNVNGTIDDAYRGRYQSDVIGEMSVAMARRMARRDRPFFMYVNYVAPHFGGPDEPDDPPAVLGDDGKLRSFATPARPEWVRGRFDDLIDRGRGLPRDGGPSELDISDKPGYLAENPELNAAERLALRELTRQRAESIYVMDRQLARLVAELKRSGAWADTVFAFTSDNGYYLGEHRWRSGKVHAHEPSLRVPLLMTGPGMRERRVVDHPVTTVDLTATILDLGRARAPHPADGRSVLPALAGAGEGWDRPVLNESTHGRGMRQPAPGFAGPRTSIGVRTGRYSYIRNRTGEDELYDLWRDPVQETNVAGTPSYRRVERELRGVWWRLRDCAGEECQVRLPEILRVEADALRRHTRGYWRAMERTYGYR